VYPEEFPIDARRHDSIRAIGLEWLGSALDRGCMLLIRRNTPGNAGCARSRV
jgi:hypothetical protein